MKDKLFGTLEWTGSDWHGRISFPVSKQCGKALDVKDPPNPRPPGRRDSSPTKRQLQARAQLEKLAAGMTADPNAAVLKALLAGIDARGQASKDEQEEEADAEDVDEYDDDEDMAVPSKVKCELLIDGDGRMIPGKPTQAQRAAWNALLARADKLWDDVLSGAFQIYRRQRPIRRRWFKAIYGDYLIDHRLPAARTLRDFRALCRPVTFQIELPDKNATSTDIYMHVLCTWSVDPFVAVIRDGQLAEIGFWHDILMEPERNKRRRIEHPVFGPLSRGPSDKAWRGLARFDPFLDFAAIAEMRAEYMNDRRNAERPHSRMLWEFADGQFELRVHAADEQAPSTAQAEAFAAFRNNQDKIAAEVIETMFKLYQAMGQAWRDSYADRDVDDVLPVIDSPSGLHELIQLNNIQVHSAVDSGKVKVEFEFVAVFENDGISATWCRGQPIECTFGKDTNRKKFP